MKSSNTNPLLSLKLGEKEESKYNAIDSVTDVSRSAMEHTVDLRRKSTNVTNINLLQSSLNFRKMMKQNVLRICIVSILLIIGYATNTVSVLKSSVISKQFQQMEIWIIFYTISSICLFVSCCVMMFAALYDFYGNKVNVPRYQKVIFSSAFFICVCTHILSLVTALLFEKSNKQIYWEHDLIYSLLPIYLYILCSLYFSNKSSQKTAMIKLTIFSLVLFVTPFMRLLVTIIPISAALNITEISIYSCLCIATSILVWIHAFCFLKHYKSGLFLQTIVISALLYGMCEYIRQEIDFEKYSDKYRIYYYYAFSIALYALFLCEIFVKPSRIVIQKSAEYYRSKKSYNPNIAQHESALRRLSLALPTSSLQSQYSNWDDIINYSEYSQSREGVKKQKKPIIRPISVESVMKIFPDFKPCKENKGKYFSEIEINIHKKEERKRLKDSITAIVPFYNEPSHELLATLRSLYFNFRYIKEQTQDPNSLQFDDTHFNVLLVGDGWFKSHKSTRKYLAQLYNYTTIDERLKNIDYKQNEHNTVILQTKGNQKLCINPFRNTDDRLYLKVTTILKIDNRKKANSHEWFLGKYGFADWCKCDYMYFTDAYSTLNHNGLYQMTNHMKDPKNKDVVCCTGRARVYTIEQEEKFEQYIRDDATKQKQKQINLPDLNEETEEKYTKWRTLDIFKDETEDQKDEIENEAVEVDVYHNIKIGHDHRLSVSAHMRACQQFEFEALYGTIGCYLLGGFLPVIPGPCGFYRSKFLRKEKVRGWYFKTINEKNDPNNLDLLLGNMKLAEDRVLTITSIFNCDVSVRHSLLSDCVFYFDPMPDLTSLMKQRRRWINGSIATIILVLRKVSFKNWKVSCLRRFYVLLVWYMQLSMFLVLFFSAPIVFIISFQYGLRTILETVLVDFDAKKENQINTCVTLLMVFSWLIYLAFIYFAQTTNKKPNTEANKLTKFNYYFKEKSVTLMLLISFPFGVLTMTGLIMQFVDVIEVIAKPDDFWKNNTFDVFVAMIGVVFFLQSFVLAPIFSKDIETLFILLKTGGIYFIYAPFYVIFFFVNAIANIHDLSWGTRPDNETENDSNPKQTTWKVLVWLLLTNIAIAIVMIAIENVVASIIIFGILSLPSLFQLFWAFFWLATTRFMDLMRLCMPKKMDYRTEFTNEK